MIDQSNLDFQSKLAKGTVIHRRHHPKPHHFEYPLYFTLLDLAEVEKINSLPFWSSNRASLVRYKRSDYLEPINAPIQTVIEDHLKQARVSEKPHRILLLTHLRQWGFSFNPVSFYFCYNEDDVLIAILSEITNTPWDERHVYVHAIKPTERGHRSHTFDFDKAFHISPFMPMSIRYQWRFNLEKDKIRINMKLFENSVHMFDASLNLTLEPLNAKSGLKLPLSFPFLPLKVVYRIYWQAFKLWIKNIPFHDHPSTHEPIRNHKD